MSGKVRAESHRRRGTKGKVCGECRTRLGKGSGRGLGVGARESPETEGLWGRGSNGRSVRTSTGSVSLGRRVGVLSSSSDRDRGLTSLPFTG